jgi:hypothetical protein
VVGLGRGLIDRFFPRMKEDFSNILILREDDGAESDLWEMTVLLATGSNSFEAFVAFNFAFERIWLANPLSPTIISFSNALPSN